MTDEQALASGYASAYRVGLKLGYEEGRKEERQRIVALINEHIVRWESGEYMGSGVGEYDEVVALKRLLREVEDTSHE